MKNVLFNYNYKLLLLTCTTCWLTDQPTGQLGVLCSYVLGKFNMLYIKVCLSHAALSDIRVIKLLTFHLVEF